MKNGDNQIRTSSSDVRADLTELGRQRRECQEAVAAAERGIAVESLQVFRKAAGSKKRLEEHQLARATSLQELEHIAYVERSFKIELEALERAEAEEDRIQHAEEGKKQAGELALVFRALDHNIKNAVAAFRDARSLLDEVRAKGYFAVGREQCDLLMTDALVTGLQGLNFSQFQIRYIEPLRRKTFAELGDKWATGMRGKADQAITSPPPAPSPPTPPTASVQTKLRGDLTTSLPGDFALGGFKVYSNRDEADAALEAAKHGPEGDR